MIKYINLGVFVCFYLTSFFSIAQTTSSIPHSLDEAISLFNAGNHNEAKTLLRQNLEHDPDDSDSRSVLGKMNYHLGEWKTAIDIWSEGLKGKPSDYELHVNIGSVFFDKAKQNAPSIYLTTYSDEKKEEEGESYEKDFLENTSTSFLKYWQNGIDSYEAAYKIYPYESYVLEKLAELYEMNREFDNAFVYHKQLAELYPENSYYITRAAIYQAKIKTYSKKTQDSLEQLVIEKLHHSLEVDNQNPDTYRELARITKKQESDKEQNEEVENDKKKQLLASSKYNQKADFYASIPEYARFDFKESEALLLDRLLTRSYSKRQAWSELIDSLATKFEDEDLISQNLLITVLASSASDSELERAFNNYYIVTKERKNIINALSSTQYGQWLLIQLLENTKEISLTKDITTTLVRKKSPNMHDVLIGLLEYDYLPESMDVAKNLSQLNDERSRAALIQELYLPLPNTSAKWRNSTYNAFQIRQMRASIALSNLDQNEDIKNELLKGLKRQDVRLFCAVALYSQTRDIEYLKLAKKFKPKKVSFPELGQFLKRFNHPKARSLADKLIKG